ncbi:hypothetical protein PHLCEN_2v3716 [Hermanssonia centrifuga]|uniref:NADP-dependent oxidoreductase domain-containing protein n=1 Tax=Hermanssonia centrifuga TaxID=98765 RepID=A0A2R6QEB0_9APHY|nr:hypothetical protein PHLCEN_2v3716 [Hermanssonia centrifuga]
MAPAVSSLQTDIPFFSLNNGIKIPSVGMGCWLGGDGGLDVVGQMCENALKCGYRHLDTVWNFLVILNEELVGKAIRESDVPRGEIFVTTKLWWIQFSPMDSIKTRLTINRRLGMPTINAFAKRLKNL